MRYEERKLVEFVRRLEEFYADWEKQDNTTPFFTGHSYGRGSCAESLRREIGWLKADLPELFTEEEEGSS